MAGVATLAVLYAWVRHLPHSGRFRGLLHSGDVGSAQGYISGALRSELVGTGGVALTAMMPGLTSLGASRITAWPKAAVAARQKPAKAIRVQRFMV